MRPSVVDWKMLRFGVEIEFIGGKPEELELLPGWVMSLDEHQLDETGLLSGSELKPPPMLWSEREQIRVMLARLKAQGASANWSCGLHVHVGIEPWGQDAVLALLDAALRHQGALEQLLRMSEHRRMYCPPVTQEIRDRYAAEPCAESVRNQARPQSQRCGINTGTWFDIGTVEIRCANGSVEFDEVLNAIELCLRFVAAVGAGANLPDNGDPLALAAALGAPASGYPAPAPAPQWYTERIWLEDALFPSMMPLVQQLIPGGELHDILPVADGLRLTIEDTDGKHHQYVVEPPTSGWTVKRQLA
ncbi:putative amidoligase enzyme [Paenibacillus taihuensis]|uniref:Putative amidoligase enzyme n=1 Tax=Paenibacillus taihuensis TaxID=1156355 RepID=A0A3D9QYD1_9BACL|nr:amidoligase family protein [Paenibacillus taihuensis]REE70506.1 putative amidoligase enzyme [Paenibacillus taihuensis]